MKVLTEVSKRFYRKQQTIIVIKRIWCVATVCKLMCKAREMQDVQLTLLPLLRQESFELGGEFSSKCVI